ncbi:phospholipase A [Phytohalomonas tamaricis]|uniref:phospholipase A n=1 Tax=Phytohalomonas tamaricis TaxID=2081032 RepID=UPI0021D3F982|nr:phospholipase A [Phytohalomonas tamaricis]
MAFTMPPRAALPLLITASWLPFAAQGAEEIQISKLQPAFESLMGINDVHDVHVWELSPQQKLVSAHLVVDPTVDRDALLVRAHRMLQERFGVAHATLQLEGTDEHAAQQQIASTEEVDASPETAAARQAEQEQSTRRYYEQMAEENPMAISVYRRNYIMPWTYNARPDQETFRDIDDDGEVDKMEIKFQLSLKVGLLNDVFSSNGDLFFAYTQRSWWQAYNSDSSSPFRETNYEPEVFMSFDNDMTLFGWTNTLNRVGFVHQSNGRSDPLSRSWNRVYLDTLFQNGPWSVSVAPFWRIPESESNDDNPDIENYVGYGDITVGFARNEQEVTLLTRGNPGKGNYGNQLDYSFPLFGKVRGFVQYYEGYGESLIDYDHYNRRIGLGFSLNAFSAGLPQAR